MRERKLKEEFIALAERLHNANLTEDQLSALHSIQHLHADGCDLPHRTARTKRKTFLIAALLLLAVALCFTRSQLAAILLDSFGLQVICKHFRPWLFLRRGVRIAAGLICYTKV